jgi:hypothetical protein
MTKQEMITIKNVKFKKPKKKTYPNKLVKEGAKIESEHTPNKKVQEIIAKNHIDEDKKYYKKLKKLEKMRKSK